MSVERLCYSPTSVRSFSSLCDREGRKNCRLKMAKIYKINESAEKALALPKFEIQTQMTVNVLMKLLGVLLHP